VVFFYKEYRNRAEVIGSIFRKKIIPHYNDKSYPGLLTPPFLYKLINIWGTITQLCYLVKYIISICIVCHVKICLLLDFTCIVVIYSITYIKWIYKIVWPRIDFVLLFQLCKKDHWEIHVLGFAYCWSYSEWLFRTSLCHLSAD